MCGQFNRNFSSRLTWLHNNHFHLTRHLIVKVNGRPDRSLMDGPDNLQGPWPDFTKGISMDLCPMVKCYVTSFQVNTVTTYMKAKFIKLQCNGIFSHSTWRPL